MGLMMRDRRSSGKECYSDSSCREEKEQGWIEADKPNGKFTTSSGENQPSITTCS